MELSTAIPQKAAPMPQRDPIDRLLTWAGWLALVALLVVAVVRMSKFEAVGGPLTVYGPLHVRGNLYVGGPLTVHGIVQARSMTVGGPITPKFDRGEKPGPDPQTYDSSLAVGGPLMVYGPLVVDGRLFVGGPVVSEPFQR